VSGVIVILLKCEKAPYWRVALTSNLVNGVKLKLSIMARAHTCTLSTAKRCSLLSICSPLRFFRPTQENHGFAERKP
jgi:hypothetical protein